ncbi:MAG: histidine kinase [Bacteroidota bacterium]
MWQRILLHVFFWLGFVLFDVVINLMFAGSSDQAYSTGQRTWRFLVYELAFLPWKIIPFYCLFYWFRPRYAPARAYGKMLIAFLFILLLCLLAFRGLIAPVAKWMYNEVPAFNVFAFRRFLFSLTEILPAFALAATVKLLRDAQRAKRREQALREEKMAAELSFLKAQTNPHFLFNTLNNLYGLARRQSTQTAPTIMQLSNIMRYILYECSAPTVAIGQEVKIIEDYIRLEQLRYDDGLDLKFDTQIDDPTQGIAPLLLLPFAENAFKHGISEMRFDRFIFISLSLNEAQLEYRVENSTSEEDTTSEVGIGLRNVKRQLELIYPGQHQLELGQRGARFIVQLKIDLHG